jgi:ligand-binding sensor protein
MNDDTNLIDISMLQQLQDQFCCADHLYLMCVDKNKGVVTKPFGTEEQVEFLRTQVDKHAYMELVDQMSMTGWKRLWSGKQHRIS